MIAVLCSEDGKTQLGSDGYVHVDGRMTIENRVNQAREYKERFLKNFPHKYEAWTHVMFVRSLKDLNNTMPCRHTL